MMKTVLMNKPEILKINRSNPDAVVIEKAVGILNAGEIIAAPTETRYGLLVRSDESTSLDKLYNIKGRPANMPTALFLNSVEHLKDFAVVDYKINRLAETFWPGSVTLVLKSNCDLSEPLVVNGRIGFRCSPSPFIKALVENVDFLLTATSANISGQPDFDTVNQVADCFGTGIALYIDGGELTGETSTVIDLSCGELELLREGAVSFEKINKVWESLK